MRLTDVRSGTPVLEVTIALSADMTGDTNGGTTVGNTRGENTDVASLMATSETHVIVLTVNGDVLIVSEGQLLDRSLDGLHSAGLTHLLGAVVGVAASTVPVTLEGLGVEGDLDIPLLGNTDEEVTSHPEVITHGDTLTRSDLELPLRGHDLGVDTRDVDTGVEASTVVGFDQVTSEDLTSTCRNKTGDGDGISASEWGMIPNGRTYQLRSSRGPEEQGNRPLASHREYHRCRGECTPAQDRTRALGPWRGP